MWMVAVLLLQAGPAPCAPTPRPSGPPALVVQAVDPGWLPLPGMEVSVALKEGKGTKNVAQTNRDGYAEFWLAREAEYGVEVRAQGFKSKRLKSLRIGKASDPSPTAYVQFQLELAGPFVTIE